MKGHGSKFNRLKQAAVLALLQNRSIADAASAIGVSHNTFLRWMKLPEFKTAYSEVVTAEFSQSTSRLLQGSSAAATVVMKIMADPSGSSASRLRAAECILNQMAKAIELLNLDARVSEMEKTLEVRNRRESQGEGS